MVRSEVVPIRFSKEERDSLLSQAKSFGVSLSEFVRRAALKRRLPPAPPPQINRDIYQELSRIGNNLNQVARKIHEGAVSVDLELVGTLTELKGVVKEVGMRVLGANQDDSETS
jgi:Bacterial mobilisation protein (MobC)